MLNIPKLLRVSWLFVLGLVPGYATNVLAEEGAGTVEEVVVTGTRRAPRSVQDAMAPIDVFSGDELQNQGTTDMNDLLRTLIPSFNVQPQPISDAATLVRPPTLRGLPGDDALILINGKRRHRSAVISFLGGSTNNGAQPVDLTMIPTMALKSVEVLRDGASAQYGADAISGVMNFIMKDNSDGFTFEAKGGQTYDGDGELTKYSANLGLPLTENGFISLTAEVATSDPTSQSVQRADAAGLRAAGNLDVLTTVQIWGDPKVDDNVLFFANAGIDLDENHHAYAFGSYGEKQVLGGFFFRNPDTRGGVFSPGKNALGQRLRLVGDVTGDMSGNCPTGKNGQPELLASDAAGLAAVEADPNCFVFNELFPGGFTPRFGARINDLAGVAGLRGTMDNGINYDVSIGAGRSEVNYQIRNTVNASFGPATPTKFRPGDYIQLEKNINADFSYPLKVGIFASDLNVAWGVQWHEEQFQVVSVDRFSFEQGPLGPQGFSQGSNGFQGFGPTQVSKDDQTDIAGYIDLEADVTDKLLIGVAARFEDFDTFGVSWTSKFSFRYEITDWLNWRGSVSSGFRAPTPGQSNVTNTSTTTNDNNVLVSTGLIPPSNPIAQVFGAKPLDTEDSTNFSMGFTGDLTDNWNVTVDYFRIQLNNRIAKSSDISITPSVAQTIQDSGIPGASELSEFNFFTNDFDTTTQGVDLVSTWSHEWAGGGTTDVSLGYNWTTTQVDSFTGPRSIIGPDGVPIQLNGILDRARAKELEKLNPAQRANLTAVHHIFGGPLGDWRFLVRVNYYDEWLQANNNVANDVMGDITFTVDSEVALTFGQRYTVVLGGTNVTNQFPPKDRRLAPIIGNKYLTSSPFGFNGGFYYARFRVDL